MSGLGRGTSGPSGDISEPRGISGPGGRSGNSRVEDVADGPDHKLATIERASRKTEKPGAFACRSPRVSRSGLRQFDVLIALATERPIRIARKPGAVACRSTRNLRQGFSLLEVLIAVVVLSVGLLGCLFLQTKALQGSHSAYHSSLASVFATDFAERLWQDRANGQAGGSWSGSWREQRDCSSANGHVCLPDFVLDYAAGPIQQRLELSWAESRFADDPASTDGRSQMVYHFLLPAGTQP